MNGIVYIQPLFFFIKKNSELQQRIIGSLLGDDNLTANTYVCAYRITQGEEHEEYVHYWAKLFEKEEYYTKKYDKINNGGWSEGKMSYMLTTQSSSELQALRELFYPDGVKIVPENIELTPLTYKHWYIEDGTLQRNKRKKGFAINIEFSTDCFHLKENMILVQNLKEVLDFSSGINLSKQSNHIRLGKTCAETFLDYIGESPVECYKYKFQRSTDK
ncbi:MAG: hypothetical protein ACFFCQ_00830 [Promethearchaeota archaeon]